MFLIVNKKVLRKAQITFIVLWAMLMLIKALSFGCLLFSQTCKPTDIYEYLLCAVSLDMLYINGNGRHLATKKLTVRKTSKNDLEAFCSRVSKSQY